MELHDHALASDLEVMLNQALNMAADRRKSLRWMIGGAASLPLLGCGGKGSGDSGDSGMLVSITPAATTTPTTTTASTSCSVIPEETGGPYPADGTNSNGSSIANVLTLSGIVRSDIRSSIGTVGTTSAVAAGVPLTIKLQLVNASGGCAALAGYAVYLWHCDRDGGYSLYSSGITTQNYLRGVQASDASGNLSFTSIFPGCYSGRMPHVHFEVYPTLAKSTSAANRIKTSQLTFPLATCNEVYATPGYSSSVRNLAQMSYATDNVFSDGYALQMASVTGNVTDGYMMTLVVAVNG